MVDSSPGLVENQRKIINDFSYDFPLIFHQAGAATDLQALRRSLIEELDRAVASEQYERAASLRDRLNTLTADEPGG